MEVLEDLKDSGSALGQDITDLDHLHHHQEVSKFITIFISDHPDHQWDHLSSEDHPCSHQCSHQWDMDSEDIIIIWDHHQNSIDHQWDHLNSIDLLWDQCSHHSVLDTIMAHMDHMDLMDFLDLLDLSDHTMDHMDLMDLVKRKKTKKKNK